jgi:hypothetical protein
MSIRPRLIAAAAALALNAAIGLALFLCFRLPVARDTGGVTSMLIWLPSSALAPKRTEPRRTKAPRPATSSSHTSAEVLSPIKPSVAPISVEPARSPVDWWAEAERVVQDRARDSAPAVPDDRIDMRVASPRDAPPHQIGESYKDELGDKVVWVSEKCYIESQPPLPGTPPAFAAARTTRVYCPGGSTAVQADSFKDPAYRKSHPDLP